MKRLNNRIHRHNTKVYLGIRMKKPFLFKVLFYVYGNMFRINRITTLITLTHDKLPLGHTFYDMLISYE